VNCEGSCRTPEQRPNAILDHSMSHSNDEVRLYLHRMLALRTLESKRLVLRQFSQDDLKDVATWEEGPAEQLAFEAQAFLDFCSQSYDKWGMGPWGMLHKKDQRVVGNCGFCRIDFKAIIGEVNYYVAKRYRDQGLASEALQLIITFGFQDLGLAEIRASCDLDNKSSERVLQKGGLRFLRTIKSTKDHNRQKFYAITRSEYQVRVSPISGERPKFPS